VPAEATAPVEAEPDALELVGESLARLSDFNAALMQCDASRRGYGGTRGVTGDLVTDLRRHGRLSYSGWQ
jgi:hypothetical protein